MEGSVADRVGAVRSGVVGSDEASIGTTCLPARIDYLAAAASLAFGYLPLASAATAVNLPKP